MKKTTMKIMMSVAVAALAAAYSLAQTESGAPIGEQGGNPLNAVVKLEVSTAKANIFWPWITVADSSSGTGVVIGDGRILTCAHCVADASYIRVRKHNEDGLYRGTVLFVDNDADLALVGVEDRKFMADIMPLEIGTTPRPQDEVLAVGYPIGGDDISYTRGIVSRIEDITYSHSWADLLGVQVDAAINPGNSGGPVLDMANLKIVGISFQSKDPKESESLGYAIPPDIIRHFLEDIRDGRVDGFGGVTTFDCDALENPAKRRYCRMGPDQTGVIVDHVESSPANASVRVGDVILEVDGHRVSNNGRIRLAEGEPRSFAYPFYIRQVGESVPIKLLRSGSVVETSVRVASLKSRIRGWMYDREPDYFVYGGIVFTTLSLDYMVKTKARFHDDLMARRFADDEAVVISSVFADKGVEGYQGAGNSLVRNVNGVRVRSLRHLVELVDKCSDGFVCFDLDRNEKWDRKLIVDAKEMREATSRVMKRYQVPADRSEDLRVKAAQ